MPLFPGHPPFQVLTYRSPQGICAAGDEPWGPGNDARLGYISELLIGSAHSGAHIDALAHITVGDEQRWHGGSARTDLGDFGPLKGGAEELFPLWTRGILFDVPRHRGVEFLGAGEPVTAADLDGITARTGVSLEPGDVALIRTGYMQHWPDPERMQANRGPGPELSAARWLHERGVIATGSDTETYEVQPAVDLLEPRNPQPVHTFLLIEQGVYLMELARSRGARRGRRHRVPLRRTPALDPRRDRFAYRPDRGRLVLAATETRPAGLVGEAIGELRSGLIVAIVSRRTSRAHYARSLALAREALRRLLRRIATRRSRAVRSRAVHRRELANAGVRAGLLASLCAACLPRAQPATRSRGDRFLHGRTPACGSETVRAGSGAPLRGRRPRAVAGASFDLCRQTSAIGRHRRIRNHRTGDECLREAIARAARNRYLAETSARLRRHRRDAEWATEQALVCPTAASLVEAVTGAILRRRRGAGIPRRRGRDRPVRILDLAQACRPRPRLDEGSRLPRSAERLGRDSRRSRPPAASTRSSWRSRTRRSAGPTPRSGRMALT